MVYKGKLPLTALAVLMLVLVLVNIVLSLGNQSLRAEVNERQQFIAQSIQLEGLHREIITALATVALKTNDEQLKSLLASQGISFSPNPAPARAGSNASWRTNYQPLRSFKIRRLWRRNRLKDRVRPCLWY